MPVDVHDTPITQITIRPTHPTKASINTSTVNVNRGRKIEYDTPIIKVLKKPATEKPSSITHPKKYDSNTHTNSTESNRIFITRAKLNGSFLQSHLNSTRDAKQWTVYKLKPAKRIHLTMLKPQQMVKN